MKLRKIARSGLCLLLCFVFIFTALTSGDGRQKAYATGAEVLLIPVAELGFAGMTGLFGSMGIQTGSAKKIGTLKHYVFKEYDLEKHMYGKGVSWGTPLTEEEKMWDAYLEMDVADYADMRLFVYEAIFGREKLIEIAMESGVNWPVEIDLTTLGFTGEEVICNDITTDEDVVLPLYNDTTGVLGATPFSGAFEAFGYRFRFQPESEVESRFAYAATSTTHAFKIRTFDLWLDGKWTGLASCNIQEGYDVSLKFVIKNGNLYVNVYSASNLKADNSKIVLKSSIALTNKLIQLGLGGVYFEPPHADSKIYLSGGAYSYTIPPGVDKVRIGVPSAATMERLDELTWEDFILDPTGTGEGTLTLQQQIEDLIADLSGTLAIPGLGTGEREKLKEFWQKVNDRVKAGTLTGAQTLTIAELLEALLKWIAKVRAGTADAAELSRIITLVNALTIELELAGSIAIEDTKRINWDKVTNAWGGLGSVFPFCIPADMITMFTSMQGLAKPLPDIDVNLFPFIAGDVGRVKVKLVGKEFNGVVHLFRIFMFLLFSLGLAAFTSRVIKW